MKHDRHFRPVPQPRVLAAARADGGHGLAEPVRAHMESAFKLDLGRVRIHDGERAAAAAEAFHARAFTVGRDVFLGRDERPEGDLLAHELAHSAQQGFAERAPITSPSHAADRDEVEADRAVRSIRAGTTPALQVAAPHVARQPKPDPEPDPEPDPDAKPVDTWGGSPVSNIIISKARGVCLFFIGNGETLKGKASTDLAPGNYKLSRGDDKHLFKIKDVGGEVRFEVNLGESSADPWTLSYPDECPLQVVEGLATSPHHESGAEAVVKDPTWFYENIPAEKKPVEGIDDYETLVQRGDGTYLATYRDGTTRIIAYADLTPKMRKEYSKIHAQQEADLFDFEIDAFMAVWPIISMTPLAPMPGPRRSYIPNRVPLPKPVAEEPIVSRPVTPNASEPMATPVPATPKRNPPTGPWISGNEKAKPPTGALGVPKVENVSVELPQSGQTPTAPQKIAAKQALDTGVQAAGGAQKLFDGNTSERGLAIENIANKVYGEMGAGVERCPTGYDYVDHYYGGTRVVDGDVTVVEGATVISDKSMDLRNKTAITAKGIEGYIKREHINKLYAMPESFEKMNLRIVKPKSKIVNLWYGPGEPSAEQLKGMQEASDHAALNNIHINYIKIP